MAAPKTPTLRLVFYLEKSPASLGTDVYRWATEWLPDVPVVEGRIKEGSFALIEQALSSHDGHYAGSSGRCVLDDQDSMIGALLGTAGTEWFIGRDCVFEVLSVEGRAAGLTWRPIMHGRVSDCQPAAGRTVNFEIRDLLSSEFAGIALDRPFGRVLISKHEHPDCPASLLGQMYPIMIGEHSDKGTKDSAGNLAEQGVIPLKFVGWQRITDAGELGGSGGPVFCGPPQNLVAIPHFTNPGSRTLYYAVSALTGTGETPIGNIVTVTNAPDVALDSENYVELTWEEPLLYGAQVTGYRINGRESDPPTRYVQLVGAVLTFNDEGQDGENLPAAPEVSDAIVSTPITGGSERAWGKFLVALGAVRPTALFLSDLGGDEEARAASGRKPYPMDSADVLSPYLEDGIANPGWPLATPYIEPGGVRQTIIFIEGPRVQDHLDGKVTIAVNCCGYDADGDQSGPVVDQPGEAIPLLFNEFLMKNNGEGYKSGNFGPLEAFQDGTAKINTASFKACQDLTKIWLGNAKGYLCALYVDDVTVTTRQVLQWAMVTTGWFFTAANFGQIWSTAIDDTAELAGAKQYRRDIEIEDNDTDFPPAEIRYTDIETRINYQFHWMPDQGKYRSEIKTIADDEAKDALRGQHHDVSLDLRFTNDRATATDAMARRLLRRKYPAKYQKWKTAISGIEQNFTPQPVLVTHPGGGLGGYVERPFFLMSKGFEPNLDASKGVTQFNAMDVLRILESTIDWFKDVDSEFTDTGSEFR